MDLQRNIDIGIESAQAKRGASAVNRALDSIKRKSRALASSASRDTAKMRTGFAGLKSMLVGLGGVLAGRSLIGSTKDFGQAVADLSAITGATGQDLEFLRQKSMEFGETTTLSASQAAEAFRLIASAKPDLLTNARALSQVTEEAIALAEATGDDLPTAADTLGSSLNQFNVGAEEASRFINVLAAGSKFGAAQVRDIAEAMKFAGGIASNLANISFEETNAALQLMSQFAIKGGEAGTQLRMILIALETQADNNLKPSIVGLQQALDNLAGANLGAEQAAKLFGSRNVNAATILINQREKVEDLTKSLTGSSIAYEQQAIRTDTLEGDVLALKSAYEGLELTIGSAGVEGALRQMTQAATENIRAISRNPLTTRAVQATLSTTATILADIKLLFSQITGILTESGGGAAVWAGAWQGAIERVVNWSKFLWEQFVVGGPANLKLGITLMIAAFDRFRIRVTEVWDTIGARIQQAVDVIASYVLGTWRLLGPNVERIFVVMGNSIGGAFDGIRLGIAETFESMIGDIQQRVFNAARSLSGLGMDDAARNLTDVGIALGGVARATDDVREKIAANERQRQAEIQAIDNTIAMLQQSKDSEIRIANETAAEKIGAIQDAAEAARLGSRVAVEGAIEERDSTLEAIQALREKRDLLAGGGAGVQGEGSEGPAALTPAGTAAADVAGDAADAFEELGEVSQSVTDGIASGIADMAASGKANFSDMAKSIIQDIIRIWIKSQLLQALTTWFGGATSSAIGAGSAASTQVAPPAARGLDFVVGGSGGVDSQLVAFRATPGETVSVNTPAQERVQRGGGVKIEQSLSIDARGADAARIEAQLPIWAERIKQDTLQQVVVLRDKGYLRS